MLLTVGDGSVQHQGLPLQCHVCSGLSHFLEGLVRNDKDISSTFPHLVGVSNRTYLLSVAVSPSCFLLATGGSVGWGGRFQQDVEMLSLYHYHMTLWEMGGSRAEMALERETLVLNTAVAYC